MSMHEREPRRWESYEQVATFLLNQFASHFGLGRVEGKQVLPGVSGAEWEIDAKAVLADSNAFLVVECRRYTNSRLDQEAMAAIAYRISDVGADGGIVVTPLDLQRGAKTLAESARIQHVVMRPDSTTADYFLQYLSRIFVGLSDAATTSDSAVIELTRADGTIERREVSGGS
jgi:hypothetical protein